MAYDKLSLASFKDALKNSTKYKSATGARRAVGKATTLSDADKDAARKLIEAHFGASPTEKPAKAAKTKTPKAKAAKAPKAEKAPKAPKAPKAVKTAAVTKPAKTGAKRGPKPGYKKATQERTQEAHEATAYSLATLGTQGTPLRDHNLDLENFGSVATQMRIAEKTITTVSAGLNAITAAKEKFPEAELSSIVEEMSSTMAPSFGIFRNIVDRVKAFQATSAVHAAVAKPARHVAKVEETEDFDDSIPPGSNVNGIGGAAKTSAQGLYSESLPVAQG